MLKKLNIDDPKDNGDEFLEHAMSEIEALGQLEPIGIKISRLQALIENYIGNLFINEAEDDSSNEVLWQVVIPDLQELSGNAENLSESFIFMHSTIINLEKTYNSNELIQCFVGFKE